MTNKKPELWLRFPDGKAVNLIEALPMTLGDWEAFEEKGLMEGESGSISITKPRQQIDFLTHLARKVDPKITREQVAGIAIRDLPNVGETLLTFVGGEKTAKRDDVPSRRSGPGEGSGSDLGPSSDGFSTQPSSADLSLAGALTPSDV
jgi:hypothetical protein